MNLTLANTLINSVNLNGEGPGPAPISPEFIIEVQTFRQGISNSNQFRFSGAVGEYDVEAYENDSLVATFNDLVNEQTITFPSVGTYELRVIPKQAGFNKLSYSQFNDGPKLSKILDWGLYGVNEPNQIAAFRGLNIEEIPGDGAWFDVVTSGISMFSSSSLTSLPEDMDFSNLTNGQGMFFSNNLTSLPSGMELPNLTDGGNMFSSNSLTSLPPGMELPNLTSGISMFSSNSLTSLPPGMELPLLTNGSNMFISNNLTSLPSGMKLDNLTSGFAMFRNNSLTSLPSGMKLPNLTNGRFMFIGSTINTARYSQLLIDLEANNPNNNVEFNGGTSKYNTQGEIARNALLSRGWTIVDGGLE